MVETDEALLDQLKRVDAHGAWAEFYQLYWLAVIRYACKLGLSHTQAQDVLQETMMALMRLLPQFEYDPARGRFRNFLLTIVHRRALAAMRRRSRESEMPFDASGLCDRLEQEPPSLEDWREAVLEEALCRLRRDYLVDERTLNVFLRMSWTVGPQPKSLASLG